MIYNIQTRYYGVINLKDRNHDKLCQTYWDLMHRVQSDPEYRSLQQRLAELEPQYAAILASLPEEDQLALDRYITLRENLDRRMVEYACRELTSPLTR